MNLPHALATLSRDVLQNYKPVWWGRCDLGSYRLEGEPLYGVDRPVRCVGEDGSVVYAPLHFEHPPLLVKGRLKE